MVVDFSTKYMGPVHYLITFEDVVQSLLSMCLYDVAL